MSTIRERNGKWQALVRLTLKGIEHKESRTFDTKRMATDWANRLEATLKNDGAPQRILATQTLGELIRRYGQAREDAGHVSRSMQHEYDMLSSLFDSTKLANLTAQTFIEFATKRKNENGTGPSTLLHNLATVRAVLNASKAMFGIPVNGAAVTEAVAALGRIGRVSKSTVRERRAGQDEIDTLLGEFDRVASHPSTKIPMTAIVKLAVALPRRLGELLDMRWTDYNRTDGTFKLIDTKHPTLVRNEIVPVPPEAALIIEKLPVVDERILPYESPSVSAAFARCCKRLGIVDLHFHDLRHEGITRLFESGLLLQEVALISGHQSWAMLRRYTHIKPSDVAKKMNKPRGLPPNADQ